MIARTTRSDGLFGSDDILSVLLEAVVRSVWILAVVAVGLVKTGVRFPALVLPAALVVAGRVWLGGRGVILALAAAAVILSGWFVLHRPTLMRFVLDPLVGLPRLLLYRARWGSVVRRSGLVLHDLDIDAGRRDARPLRLVRVRIFRSGLDRLLVRLPVGMVPADVEEGADALAHAFGCLAARVQPHKPGMLWLELVRRDSLTARIAPLTAAGPADLAEVSVGRHEDGTRWSIRLTGTHLLVAGATGSGKSSVLWSMLHGLGEDIRSGRVQVWAVDPKGGMELRPGRGLFTRFADTTPEDMCALLEDLVAVKDARAKALAASGDRVHTATTTSPHIVAVLDELATLTAFAERTVTRRIDTALGLLLTQGRACGITVVAAVQDPGKDIVGWRDLFPTRVAMRLDNPIQVAMVLGDGAREMGAKADEISELTPGVAYVRTEGTRAIRRVRAAYLDDDDITTLAQVYAPADSTTTVTALPVPTLTGGEPT